MLRIDTHDGRTQTVDLTVRDEFERWSMQCIDGAFQNKIRCLSIVVKDGNDEVAILSCPCPKFRRISWDAAVVFHPETGEPVRETVTCYYDSYATTLTVYCGTRPIRSRIDTWRSGKRMLPVRAIP